MRGFDWAPVPLMVFELRTRDNPLQGPVRSTEIRYRLRDQPDWSAWEALTLHRHARILRAAGLVETGPNRWEPR